MTSVDGSSSKYQFGYKVESDGLFSEKIIFTVGKEPTEYTLRCASRITSFVYGFFSGIEFSKDTESGLWIDKEDRNKLFNALSLDGLEDQPLSLKGIANLLQTRKMEEVEAKEFSEIQTFSGQLGTKSIDDILNIYDHLLSLKNHNNDFFTVAKKLNTELNKRVKSLDQGKSTENTLDYLEKSLLLQKKYIDLSDVIREKGNLLFLQYEPVVEKFSKFVSELRLEVKKPIYNEKKLEQLLKIFSKYREVLYEENFEKKSSELSVLANELECSVKSFNSKDDFFELASIVLGVEKEMIEQVKRGKIEDSVLESFKKSTQSVTQDFNVLSSTSIASGGLGLELSAFISALEDSKKQLNQPLVKKIKGYNEKIGKYFKELKQLGKVAQFDKHYDQIRKIKDELLSRLSMGRNVELWATIENEFSEATKLMELSPFEKNKSRLVELFSLYKTAKNEKQIQGLNMNLKECLGRFDTETKKKELELFIYEASEAKNALALKGFSPDEFSVITSPILSVSVQIAKEKVKILLLSYESSVITTKNTKDLPRVFGELNRQLRNYLAVEGVREQVQDFEAFALGALMAIASKIEMDSEINQLLIEKQKELRDIIKPSVAKVLENYLPFIKNKENIQILVPIFKQINEKLEKELKTSNEARKWIENDKKAILLILEALDEVIMSSSDDKKLKELLKERKKFIELVGSNLLKK